jgi:hypothetical protein
MTNGDKIRKMNDEELARVINKPDCYMCEYDLLTGDECMKLKCIDGILAWLQKEADK